MLPFGLSKEVLIGLLVVLVVVLVFIIFFIFRKRRTLKTAQPAPAPAPPKPPEKTVTPAPAPQDQAAQPTVPATGPSDTGSIKASILETGVREPEEEFVSKDTGIEQGIELEEARTLMTPYPAPQKPAPPPVAAQPKAAPKLKGEPGKGGDKEFVVMGEYAEPEKEREVIKLSKEEEAKKQAAKKVPPAEPGKAPPPPAQPPVPQPPAPAAPPVKTPGQPAPAKPAAAQAPPPQQPAPAPEPPAPAKPGEAEKTNAANINQSPGSFSGKTVMVEGDLHPSSKGTGDFWYVFFDTTGSAVVRSNQEIPYEKCRLYGKVEKTRLGQVYLEVQNFEKI